MPATASPFAPASLTWEGKALNIVDLPAIAGERLGRMPMVLRLLLENVVRNAEGEDRERAVAALLAWVEHAHSEDEVPFVPGRVLMHDTTSTPALVDVAAMRDVLAEHGKDPSLLSPVMPVEVSVDHSLAVEVFAHPDAVTQNMAHEIRRNQERYRFLRWSSQALDHVHVNPPGTGIMHTINLEQLATVVTTEQRDDQTWLVPDMMLGTDSHTPMINGIGVLGWGVGGLEAQTAMFGMPTMLRIPPVVGVYLTGHLQEGVQATDLALRLTQLLRALDVAGEFVEFFGPGVSTLSAGQRAAVANMGPEYGATTGYFRIDEQVLTYLRETGRDAAAVARIEAYARHVGLWFDPATRPNFTRVLELDLGTVACQVAGPRRPQDAQALAQVPRSLLDCDEPGTTHPVLIAAITSCTNTSDPGLLMAAGLVARKARAHGLQVPPWVKTSLSPGSPAAASYLRRAGVLEDLEALGFGIVGYGCATCIGNPGPVDLSRMDLAPGERKHAVAVLSGNRNFPGRVSPLLDLGFLMSPAMVVAYAIAGTADRDLQHEPLAHDPDGRPVHLSDLLPSHAEVQALLKQGLRADDFPRDFQQAAGNPLWAQLAVAPGARFHWESDSNYLRRPPFASLAYGSQLGRFEAYPLLAVGDDVTTDHISPASAIPGDSPVADYLVARGEQRDDLNVFASRRGNWEVMSRAAFYSRSLKNRLNPPDAPVAHTVHVPSGALMPIWDASQRYQAEGHSVVIVAGERYGTGSSRDWAAKGQRMLGVRAVLACSFERIHRSNLIGMGILPVQLTAGPLEVQVGDRIQVVAEPDQLAPRAQMSVACLKANGDVVPVEARLAVETQFEIELLRAGGVIPRILASYL